MPQGTLNAECKPISLHKSAVSACNLHKPHKLASHDVHNMQLGHIDDTIITIITQPKASIWCPREVTPGDLHSVCSLLGPSGSYVVPGLCLPYINLIALPIVRIVHAQEGATWGPCDIVRQ